MSRRLPLWAPLAAFFALALLTAVIGGWQVRAAPAPAAPEAHTLAL